MRVSEWFGKLRGTGLFPVVMAGIGAALAIGAMEWFSMQTRFPLWAVPFATSIVLVMGSPETRPAQPRALIGGHLVSTLVGLLVLAATGPGALAAAMAVGIAVVAMQLTGTFHPPAGINPLIVVANGLGWSFLVYPVALGAITLALFAWFWHRVVRGHAWPERWY